MVTGRRPINQIVYFREVDVNEIFGASVTGIDYVKVNSKIAYEFDWRYEKIKQEYREFEPNFLVYIGLSNPYAIY